MNYRVFVEKKEGFRVEAVGLQDELNANVDLDIRCLRLINIYDLFGFSQELLDKCLYSVFGEIVTDRVSTEFDFEGCPYIAVEFLPGQFDQRASSAEDCVHLIDPKADITIKSGKILVFDKDFAATDIDKVKKYFVNPIESRIKDISVLERFAHPAAERVSVIENFTNLKEEDLAAYCEDKSLAMNTDDLREVVAYFRKEGRNPYETELKILDTYWSDHCRHTTFNTQLESIEVEECFAADKIKSSLDLYRSMRNELHRQSKDICLMDIATIGAKHLKTKGYLDDLEQSEENNACSVYVDVDVDGQKERWLLMFKNETHNHPTEIEPFGGASTCLGGAIRDPLSGRSYVYQAMRVTGAGNIYMPVTETIQGKLPQRIISTKAANGYSSYGNQIGLATTFVREIYHDNYVAKRLEVGAVVGAVRADNVRRETPKAGDVVIMLGGRTGRDGVGGATGSSKEHNANSLELCSSEVQKGNAPEERKLERLFRRSEVTRLIKKSNDFGAGGVCVAIGELADGLDIYLDRVKTKYSGLSGTELAISESQERMAVVLDKKDMAKFIDYCGQENIEVSHIADVTDSNRLRMYLKDEKIVDISRQFIDSAGARHTAKAKIAAVELRNPFVAVF
jgi:phosphoribosylformylglycinamidine synthase